MARPKSVILSKDEKKEIIAKLKSTIKGAKLSIKTIDADEKAKTKELDKLKKENAKLVAAAQKVITSNEAQLQALTPPKA